MLPFPVIVGEEVSTQSGHVIGLFLRDTVPPGLSVAETIGRIRDQGGLVCLPHPFDRVRSSHLTEAELAAVAGQVDMVEVFNSRNLFDGANRAALAYARASHRVHAVGSDAHSAAEVGKSYVEMAPFATPEQFLANLRGASVRTRRTPLALRALVKLRRRLRGPR